MTQDVRPEKQYDKGPMPHHSIKRRDFLSLVLDPDVRKMGSRWLFIAQSITWPPYGLPLFAVAVEETVKRLGLD